MRARDAPPARGCVGGRLVMLDTAGRKLSMEVTEADLARRRRCRGRVIEPCLTHTIKVELMTALPQ